MTKISFALLLVLASAVRATVPGGSGSFSDCYSEFDGITETYPGTYRPRVVCTDGDPSCDTDGVCGNGVCVFRVRLCINRFDPAIPVCQPPRGGLTSLHVVPHAFSALASGLDLRSSACGAFVDVPVEVLRRRQNWPGRQPLRVVARANARPPTDKDQVVLICKPRPVDDVCPPPNGSTTTTTGPPATSTTSTTAPAATTTTSTLTSTTTVTTTTTSTSSSTTSTTVTTSTTTTTIGGTTSTTSTTTTSSSTTTSSTTASTTSTAPLGTTTTTTTTTSTSSSTTSTVVTTSTTIAVTTSTTTSTVVPTTTTSTTTTIRVTTSTTTSTTTTTVVPTTTTTTSTTTTTLGGLSSCPAGGKVDVITTLVPGLNTFNSTVVLGLQVELTYPGTVSMPGTQFLPVNDPADPATLIALLNADPNGINLYDGSQTFFDADTTSPFKLKTLLTLNPTANLIFNQTISFERARFTCTPGNALSVSSFPCVVSSEVDVTSRPIPADQRPACSVTLSAP